MVLTLLIIGSITGLVCVVLILEALSGSVTKTSGAFDLITLGLYLAVTVTCFAGAGIIRAVNKLREPIPTSRPVDSGGRPL